MKLVTFRRHGGPRLGAVVDTYVLDLNSAFRCFLQATDDDCESDELIDALVPPDALRYLRGGARSARAVADVLAWWSQVSGSLDREAMDAQEQAMFHNIEDVDLYAPIPRPKKVVCVGLNYRDHAAELGIPLPDRPVLFSKFSTSIVGPHSAIEFPDYSSQLDFEAEMAIIIGKSGRRIHVNRAMEHVAGYSVFNDVSVRDIMFADGQWLRGKAADTHAPFGPYLVTRDEVANPDDLSIELRVNGEVQQSSSTAQMAMGVAELVSYISESVTLEVGDVIATGTPPGVGYAQSPPRFLVPGDTVQVEIAGLGTLENIVSRSSSP